MESNTDIVRQMIEAWDSHDAAKAVGLLAETFEYWDVTQHKPFRSKAEVQTFFDSYFDAFPNVHYKVLDIFAVGDQVACEWRMEGTQEKPLEGLDGVGKTVELVGASLVVLKNKQIVRQTDYWDSGTMMRQLGAIN